MVFIVIYYLIIYIIYTLKCSVKSLVALWEAFWYWGMKVYGRKLNDL